MSYLISNLMFSLIATFLMGLLFGWFFWGRLKNKIAAVEMDWRHRYLKLDSDYQSLATNFSELELDFNNKTTRVSELNTEKNTLAGKLSATSSATQETDKEVEELKNQLGQITARCHITSKELDARKQELETLRSMPDEVSELKTLLGKATQRYNNNGLELNNANEEIFALQAKSEETNKRAVSVNKELDHLRTKLLKRDKEFEMQVVSFANLKNELNTSNKKLSETKSKLDSQNNQTTLENSSLKERDEKILALQNQLLTVSKQSEASNAELLDAKKHIPALNNEIVSLRERTLSLEGTIKQRDSSINALEGEINRLASEFPPLRDELDARSSLTDDLKQQAHVSLQQVSGLKSTISARDAHIRELEILIKEAQKTILKPTNQTALKNGNGHHSSKTTNGNGKTNGNGNVVHINGTSKMNGNGKAHHNGSAKPNGVDAKNQTIQKPAKRKIKSYGLKKPTRKPDDLMLISGIGEVLEKTLHKCGIYYFEQIAGFTRKDVAAVDDMLNFKGRIDRDDWIKQSRSLMRSNKKNTATNNKASQKQTTTRSRSAKMKPLGMKRPAGELDDLQLINGVGPTLERKLHRLGIYHYEQIAHLTTDDIELIDSKLKTYKGRVKRDKWPMQARRLHKEFYVSAVSK